MLETPSSPFAESSQPDLLAAVIHLRPLQPGLIPADQGLATFRLFLDWVEIGDKQRAKTLHEGDGEQVRPFTVSDLQGKRLNRSGEAVLDPQRPLVWRFTTLDSDLTRLMIQGILYKQTSQGQTEYPQLPKTVRLAGQELEVIGAATEAHQHPWAGQTSYAALTQQYALHPGEAPRSLTIELKSPTTFHTAEKFLPFPLPELIVEGWLEKWNQSAPMKLPQETKRFAKECIAVTRYHLQTRVVRYGKIPWIGCSGWCVYRILRPDPYWARLMHLLAAYAFYCGSGKNTSEGMGQSRLKDEGD